VLALAAGVAAGTGVVGLSHQQAHDEDHVPADELEPAAVTTIAPAAPPEPRLCA
jgi:hypothetical protein